MKSLVTRLSLCVVLFMAFSITACSATALTDVPAGITFFTGSWKDVLAEAKRQNKPVFLDIYTTWCPPCKRMAKEALPNPKIGAKFNVHFINYQVDAEKGAGIELAKKYTVSSYPTALYITPNGDLIHRSIGYAGVNGMLDQADIVLDMSPMRATIAKGDKDYVEERRDPGFLKKYLKVRKTLNRPTSDVLDAYLNALPESERSTNEAMTFVVNELQSSSTKAFDFLLKTQSNIVASKPVDYSLAKVIFGALYRALSNDFKQAIATNDEALLEKVITNNERSTVSAYPSFVRQEAQKQEAANDYRLEFYKQTKNFVKYRDVAGPIAQNQLMSQSVTDLRRLDSITAVGVKNTMVFAPDSIRNTANTLAGDSLSNGRILSSKVARSLHEIADTYRALGFSSADWELAVIWAERAVELIHTHTYLNTYALLLKKLGRSNEAFTAQEEAIREASKAGLEITSYKKELTTMQKQ